MRLTWLHLLVYGLACFRLALLLSEDDGPWGMFRRFRSFLKKEAKNNTTLRRSEVHRGISCVKCDSIWVATPIAVFAYHRDRMDGWGASTADIVLLVMAISAMAILWNRIPKA